MIWSQLLDALAGRRDVAALCSRYGYDSFEELLDGTVDNHVADCLVADLADGGALELELALAILAPRLRRAIGGIRAWTGDDAAELIVAACWERLRKGKLPPPPDAVGCGVCPQEGCSGPAAIVAQCPGDTASP